MSEKKLGDYIITVKDVCKTFPGGIAAVKDFSTDIRRSEVSHCDWVMTLEKGCHPKDY